MSAPTYSTFAVRFAGEAVLSSDTDVQAGITSRLSWWWDALTNAPNSTQRTEACLLRVAHERQWTVDRGAATGTGSERKVIRQSGRVVSSRQVGDHSTTFSTPAQARTPGEAVLLTSDWGLEFLALTSGWPTLPVVGGYR